MAIADRFAPAFTTVEGREAFFADRRRDVAAGTALRHVLGTAIGIWTDTAPLRRDCARIVARELDCWADAEGEERLALPLEAVAGAPLFNEAFNACLKAKMDELDDLVAGCRIAAMPNIDLPRPEPRLRPEEDPAIAHFLSRDFVERLYLSLCRLADAYGSENERHGRALASMGMGRHR